MLYLPSSYRDNGIPAGPEDTFDVLGMVIAVVLYRCLPKSVKESPSQG